jgi:predicted nucleic acid-binding protein
MRCYVETNFVLEIAFDQRQRSECETLLRWADSGRLDLAAPAYCLAEPFETLGRRHNNRQQVQKGLQEELSQLGRSARYREATRQVQLTADLFAQSVLEDRERLQRSVRRLAETSILIPMSAVAFERSFELRNEFDLDLKDALVLASVAGHLESEPTPAVFVTRNSKDFDDPDLRSFLEDRSCQLATRFGDVLSLVA